MNSVKCAKGVLPERARQRSAHESAKLTAAARPSRVAAEFRELSSRVVVEKTESSFLKNLSNRPVRGFREHSEDFHSSLEELPQSSKTTAQYQAERRRLDLILWVCRFMKIKIHKCFWETPDWKMDRVIIYLSKILQFSARRISSRFTPSQRNLIWTAIRDTRSLSKTIDSIKNLKNSVNLDHVCKYIRLEALVAFLTSKVILPEDPLLIVKAISLLSIPPSAPLAPPV
jgi:hypothetical protein